MGRKIRTGALLILVLVMIYTQQAVIYAQNEAEKNMKKATESENSDGTNGEAKEPEKPGGEEGDKEPEKPGGEDEDKDKEPEQPEIKRYELEIPKADGKNGYYLSKPSVMIQLKPQLLELGNVRASTNLFRPVSRRSTLGFRLEKASVS